MSRIFLTVFIILSFSFCSKSNEKDYKDLYALRILLVTATTPRANPQQACIDAMRAEEACIVTASDSGGLVNETNFSFQISSGRFTTYSDLCANNLYMYPLPANFVTNNSDSLRECYFRCDRSYWQTRKNLNICTGTIAAMTAGIGTDSGTSTCKRNCISVTNNAP
ncbi:MAG TPA: hypothetical protein PK079_03380 [Leptospiraceae bacterium]|nr:hypothetical protein [Leptospiraceae bacterium]HMW03796.1 hypothetical protein [Leptospiraceae bacterium]HMX34807.1 hypothetical protein [Leptospiraceae bacterium]HMY29776.1 hypothetical protein [Leptospiraceae bacterium]HMZ62825.1 hypothetical protein [Leptospiraceae bacterium]